MKAESMDIEVRFRKVGDEESAVVSIPVAVSNQDDAELLVASIAEAFDEFAPGMVDVELGVAGG